MIQKQKQKNLLLITKQILLIVLYFQFQVADLCVNRMWLKIYVRRICTYNTIDNYKVYFAFCSSPKILQVCMHVQCIPYELLDLCEFMLTLLYIPLNTNGCKTIGIFT